MPFDHEATDLSELDDADQRREVYAWVGLALYFAQVFEQGVICLIVVARTDDGTLAKDFASWDEAFDFHDKKSLGALLREVGRYVVVADGTERLAQDALAQRNLLVHRYFKERNAASFTRSGRQEMVDELASMTRLFSDADDQLTDLMYLLGAHFGLTPELVEERTAQWKADVAIGM